MNKEKALERLTALENEAAEIRIILNTPDAPPKPTATEWLLNLLSEPFEVKLTEGYITYYRDGQWIFQQDLKNEYLWCYYYNGWQHLETEYKMQYSDIQSLITVVVGKALNSGSFTPDKK